MTKSCPSLCSYAKVESQVVYTRCKSSCVHTTQIKWCKCTRTLTFLNARFVEAARNRTILHAEFWAQLELGTPWIAATYACNSNCFKPECSLAYQDTTNEIQSHAGSPTPGDSKGKILVLHFCDGPEWSLASVHIPFGLPIIRHWKDKVCNVFFGCGWQFCVHQGSTKVTVTALHWLAISNFYFLLLCNHGCYDCTCYLFQESAALLYVCMCVRKKQTDRQRAYVHAFS